MGASDDAFTLWRLSLAFCASISAFMLTLWLRPLDFRLIVKRLPSGRMTTQSEVMDESVRRGFCPLNPQRTPLTATIPEVCSGFQNAPRLLSNTCGSDFRIGNRFVSLITATGSYPGRRYTVTPSVDCISLSYIGARLLGEYDVSLTAKLHIFGG